MTKRQMKRKEKEGRHERRKWGVVPLPPPSPTEKVTVVCQAEDKGLD